MSDTVAETNVPTAEATVTEAAPVVVPEKVESGKLLDIAKKEQSFVKKEVEYKQRLADAQKELEELKYFRTAKEHYKSNPEELLGKLGIGYDELTNAVLDYYQNKEAGAKTPTLEQVRKEVEAEYAKREASRMEEASKAAIDSFTGEIKTFISSKEAEYPHLTKVGTTLAGVDSVDSLVFEVVSNYFQETGEILDLKVAADTAEEYFRDEWNKLNGVLTTKGDKVADAPKTAANAPTSEAKVEEVKVPVVEGKTSVSQFKVRDMPTINNGMRQANSVPYRGRNVAREDSIQKAVAVLEQFQKKAR